MKASYYWLSFFIFYFSILEIGLILWLLGGYILVEMTFFREGSLLYHFLFFSIWNANLILFTFLISGFLKKSKNTTLIGYIFAVFFMGMISAVSVVLFPSPSTLPIILYVLPHAGLVRYIYLYTSTCMNTECPGFLSL